MRNVNIGDRIVFTVFGEDRSWRTTCTVTAVSDPDIVTEPTHWTFSGVTDTGRFVGGYFDQVIELLEPGVKSQSKGVQ